MRSKQRHLAGYTHCTKAMQKWGTTPQESRKTRTFPASHEAHVVHQLFYLNLHFCSPLLFLVAGSGSVGGSINRYFKEISKKKILYLCEAQKEWKSSPGCSMYTPIWCQCKKIKGSCRVWLKGTDILLFKQRVSQDEEMEEISSSKLHTKW